MLSGREWAPWEGPKPEAPEKKRRLEHERHTTDHICLPTARERLPLNFRIGHLYNRGVYDLALASLPGKKAPGIDGVPNEVLKHMPSAFHDAMHDLFGILWEQKKTPQAWKRALTVLLYKKDDPQEVKNYRPIGLLTGVYKLWSSVITRCLSAYVEEHELLSDAQEGFRAGKNTIRQLQRLSMMMEDAKLTDSPPLHTVRRFRECIREYRPRIARSDHETTAIPGGHHRNNNRPIHRLCHASAHPTWTYG